MRRLALKRGAAARLGPGIDCERWKDEVNLSYSIPACYDCPNIASITKVESTSAVSCCDAAYLCTAVATEFKIDSQLLQKVDAVFHADAANEPSICVVVCPDLESCKELQLESDAVSRVLVGYFINRYCGFSDSPRYEYRMSF